MLNNIKFEVRKSGERTFLDVFTSRKHSFNITEMPELEVILNIKEILEVIWERELTNEEYDDLIMKVMDAYIRM